MSSISDYLIVMTEAIPYSGLMQRHQHLALGLSKYLPVIYVESTPSKLKRLFDLKPFDPVLQEYKKGLQPIKENLWRFKAPPCSPRSLGYWKSIEITAKQTSDALKPLLPKNKKIIQWIFSPNGAKSLGMYNESLTIFDCFDAWGEFPGEEKYKSEILEAFEFLAKNVDIVFTTSRDLNEQLLEKNHSTFLVRNGCDPDHFISGGETPDKVEKKYDPDSINTPVIGYMGDIAPWLDPEYLYRSAERHGDWSFVLLGTWKREEPPRKFSNMIVPGAVRYSVLPYYVRKFDVGTIPFAMNELTKVVNPLKLFEYFSLGLPVVSTPLPEVVMHEGLVYIAGTHDEFMMYLELAVKEKPNAPVRAKRVETARANSWKSRVNDILAVIMGKLNIA